MDEKLRKILENAHRAVFFGGAGVSVESGIPDFRSPDGLYSRQFDVPAEEILSRGYFDAHTEEFFRFYRGRMLYPAARPNAAHRALARLEAAGRLRSVVTQNIDGLHQAAGSRRVWELHGSVHRNHCMRCGRFYGLEAVAGCTGVPRCSCGGIIKPDVVLYGEALDSRVLSGAARDIADADVLVVGGTSLNVYPAAGLLRYFSGKELVVINKTPTPADRAASLVLTGPIGSILGGEPGREEAAAAAEGPQKQ